MKRCFILLTLVCAMRVFGQGDGMTQFKNLKGGDYVATSNPHTVATNVFNTGIVNYPTKNELIVATNSIGSSLHGHHVRLDIIENKTNDWNTAYSWGDWRPSNAVTTNRLAKIEGRTNDWNAAAALGETALQPSWAATGTVFRATEVIGAQSNTIATALQPSWAVTGTVSRAQAATMLASTNGNVFVNVGADGTMYVSVITNTTAVYVKSVSGTGYNGPAVGVRWLAVNSWSGSFFMEYDGVSIWVVETTLGESTGYWGAIGGTLPLVLSATVEDVSFGSLTLDWVPATNTYEIATVPGTVIMLSEHDEDPEAHPTLPRSNDVINAVSAATATADAKYVAKAGFPAGGCTDLGTATNLVIDGTSVYYTAAPASAYTITVSQPVSSGYTYCLTTYSDSPITLVNADLRNDWVLGGTNTLVFYPGTTNRWLVKGSAP